MGTRGTPIDGKPHFYGWKSGNMMCELCNHRWRTCACSLCIPCCRSASRRSFCLRFWMHVFRCCMAVSPLPNHCSGFAGSCIVAVLQWLDATTITKVDLWQHVTTTAVRDATTPSQSPFTDRSLQQRYWTSRKSKSAAPATGSSRLSLQDRGS